MCVYRWMDGCFCTNLHLFLSINLSKLYLCSLYVLIFYDNKLQKLQNIIYPQFKFLTLSKVLHLHISIFYFRMTLALKWTKEYTKDTVIITSPSSQKKIFCQWAILFLSGLTECPSRLRLPGLLSWANPASIHKSHKIFRFRCAQRISPLTDRFLAGCSNYPQK